MKSSVQTVVISQVKENTDNPRKVDEYKLEKLVDSILSFPRMLGLRPIVVDENYVALGGNMRRRALGVIGEMSIEALESRVQSVAGEGKKDELISYWAKWRDKKEVPVVFAGDLTPQQRREFIIKDNVAFGEWDKEKLASWDREQLGDWGLDDMRWEDEETESDDEEGGKEKEISTKLKVECEDLDRLASLFSELQARGFKCELI